MELSGSVFHIFSSGARSAQLSKEICSTRGLGLGGKPKEGRGPDGAVNTGVELSGSMFHISSSGGRSAQLSREICSMLGFFLACFCAAGPGVNQFGPRPLRERDPRSWLVDGRLRWGLVGVGTDSE